ncbi:MAG: N-acetyl-gamma-glutamyl-phosphate reductase, partial [Oscillospiraceae bacterium]
MNILNSNKKKIFINGSGGTTGLKIVSRLENRDDLELIILSDDKRKDLNEIKKAINNSDVTILCLPDDAAKEAILLCENENVKILDASTAHRTNYNWAYGFPELSENHQNFIKNSKRVSVPGCHASGFISIVYPLVSLGITDEQYPFVCHSITGYSGGGKEMISKYTSANRPEYYKSPRQYALNQIHKHQKEMQIRTAIKFAPIINPIVGDFYNGMCVSIPLYKRFLNDKYKTITPEELSNIFKDFYKDSIFIKIDEKDEDLENGFLNPQINNETNKMTINIFGDEEKLLITSRLDNLGKGSSGA